MPALPLVTHTASDRAVTTISLTATPPAGNGVRAFLFVSAMRSSVDNATFTITGATCRLGGTSANLTELATNPATSPNRYYIQALYTLIDPVVTLGEGEHIFTVTTSRSVAAIALTLVYASGVTQVGTPQTVDTNNAASLTLPVTTTGTPSVILAGGYVRVVFNATNQYNGTLPTGDTASLTKILTGSNEFNDLVVFTGYADAQAIGTYDLGYEWPYADNGSLLAIEVIGQYDPAALALAAQAPTVILGDITIEGLAAALALAGAVGETGLGSIPPVQVIGRGNLYFATSARNLTAILLGTTGEKWVIATAGGATE